MDKFSQYDVNAQLAEYETPFADNAISREEEQESQGSTSYNQLLSEFESPFSQTFEAPQAGQSSPLAGEFVQFLSELHDTEFPNTLYELAAELEDTWSSKISNEAAMGDRFLPFVTQQANEYFAPLALESERMIDRVSQQFSGNNLGDQSEAEIERFFSELEFNHGQFSPAQEQFFGSLFNKVKSVVKTGVDLAKKGISAVGKILPVGIILGRIKGLIRPLLDKVLKFAIGKLPKNLQPYAQTLAKKFLNLEAPGETESPENEIPSSGNLEAVQTEFDSHIANLVFSENEAESEELVMNYETSSDTLQRETNYETGGLTVPSLDAARQNFINDLRALKEGESPTPAIEKFLPAAILALQPVIKVALSVVGRQKVINFLASLLAKLIGKYVPENVAQPLAASIIDVGMSAIGFETYEMNRTDVAYEAIANTIQETMQNIGTLSEETLNNQEALTAEMLEAFETAAANNFPSQYIKEEVRPTSQNGTWVLKPRQGPRHYYKKYTRAFNAVITPQIARTLTTFRGVPLANFLRDKLGLDPTKPIQARVHLYEAIQGTRLTQVNRFEKVPGLGASQPHGAVQFHPLTVEAATLLCNEPGLGKNFSAQFTTKRHRTAVGQRFYYLEINGARLRISTTVNRTHMHGTVSPNTPVGVNAPVNAPVDAQAPTSPTPDHPVTSRVANSTDVQAVINFIRSEIIFNCYFSEEEAKSVVELLNRNDYLGLARKIRHSVKEVLSGILLSNVDNKVKIVHEAVPEMFLENYTDQQEQFSPIAALKSAVSGIPLNAGKALLTKLIETLVDKLSELANTAIANYFKERAKEFKQAQEQPQDGVTIKVTWKNIGGMSTLRTAISAIKGNLSVGNLANLSLPNIPAPEVTIIAGKQFD